MGGGGGKGVSLGGGFLNSYPAVIIFSVPSLISTKLIYSICHYMQNVTIGKEKNTRLRARKQNKIHYGL